MIGLFFASIDVCLGGEVKDMIRPDFADRSKDLLGVCHIKPCYIREALIDIRLNDLVSVRKQLRDNLCAKHTCRTRNENPHDPSSPFNPVIPALPCRC